MKTPVKTFWTVNSLVLELGAQLEFQTLFMTASAVKVLFAIAMLAQETIGYAAVLRPDKKIFKYLFLGLDIILGKLLASAGLIPLLKIPYFPAFISDDTQNTEHPWIVPALGVCFTILQTMHSVRLLGTIANLNRIDFRSNTFDWKRDKVQRVWADSARTR